MSGNKTVLVVDDEPGMRRIIETQISLNLKDVGIESAVNGEAACRSVAASSPGLVLMDILMPVMDGVEATKCMRNSGYSGPIVLNTSNDVLYDSLKNDGTGATEVVRKDYLINRGGLTEVLSRYFK